MRRLGRILALLVLGAPAYAGEADRPAVKVGDQWRFAAYWAAPTAVPNREWVVRAVTATGIEATENGEPLRLTPELGVAESPRNASSNPRELSFPLAVGKTWRYSTEWLFKPKASRGSQEVEVVVVGYEKLQVPAGEFDAYKLRSVARLGGTSPINSRYDADIETTYWYAPRARAIVKSVQRNPYLGTSTVELVALMLQP